MSSIATDDRWPSFGEPMTYQDTSGFAFIAKILIFFDDVYLHRARRGSKEADAGDPMHEQKARFLSFGTKILKKTAIKPESRVFIRSWRLGFDKLR